MAQWVSYGADKIVIQFTSDEKITTGSLPDGLKWGKVTATEVPLEDQDKVWKYTPSAKKVTEVAVADPEVVCTLTDEQKAELTADKIGTFTDPYASQQTLSSHMSYSM